MRMTERNLVQAVRDALYEEMERDDRVCVLGQDVGLKGGVFKATEGLQQRFGAERVMDMPLAESSIAAVAQGLALGLHAGGRDAVRRLQLSRVQPDRQRNRQSPLSV